MADGAGSAVTSGSAGASNSNPTRSENPPIATSARLNQNPDRQSSSNNTATSAPRTGVVQPKPQALTKRTGPGSIIVSPRQKGNPVLTSIKSVPWEYGDIPADYVLGLTTCALFLSLKYHRLHPEYIYTRIKALQGKYNLRIVLVMVDIQNHEESLRELSKTSLINNVTLILCWSSLEGGRYLELFKTYENAAPTTIKSHQSNSYADRMIDFITKPRSINKTDAVSLVSQFGTLMTAVNARHEDVSGIAGWGEKKVQRWCAAVREPFRIQRAARRGIVRDETGLTDATSRAGSEVREASGTPGLAVTSGLSPPDTSVSLGNSHPVTADADRRPSNRLAETIPVDESRLVEIEEAMAEVMSGKASASRGPTEDSQEISKKRKAVDDPLNDGVMAALSKLRKDEG